jgi:hypothetical protein
MAISPTIATMEPHKLRLRLGLGLLTWFLSTWLLTRLLLTCLLTFFLSYGPHWAHYLGGYQDRLLGGPLGLPGLRYTALEGVEHKDYGGGVLG